MPKEPSISQVKENVLRELEVLAKSPTRAAYEKQEKVVYRAAEPCPEALVELFYENEEHRLPVTWTLGHLTQYPQLIEPLKVALKDKDMWGRWAAIEGLSQIKGDSSLIPTFDEALRDRSPMVKSTAVCWLKKHGDKTSLKPLERLLSLRSLRDHSPGVVKGAKEAIERIRGTGES